MEANITQALIKELKPGDYTVADTRERNLYLRSMPSGVLTWRVRLQAPDGAWYFWKLGDGRAMKPEEARVQVVEARRRADKGEDLRESKRKLREAAAQQITLRAFLTDQYGPWVKANRKRGEETVTTIENRCADFLDVPMGELTAFTVERWRSAYLKKKRKPATINRVLNALRACLSKAVAWGVLKEHPLKAVRNADVERTGRLRYLTPDEETRLLAALQARDEKRRAARVHYNAWCHERHYDPKPEYRTFTDLLRPMVITLLHTGLRFGEACALTWGDVDLTTKLLTVRGETAKTARTRYVPLNATATDTLKAWKPEHAEPGAFVFPGKVEGQPVTDIKTAWLQLLKGMPKPLAGFRVHDLRHTFASKLVQAGVDLNTVRELLGHSDIKMTLRYAHLAPEHRAAAVAKLVQVG